MFALPEARASSFASATRCACGRSVSSPAWSSPTRPASRSAGRSDSVIGACCVLDRSRCPIGGLPDCGLRVGGSNDSDIQADPGPASPGGSVKRRDASPRRGRRRDQGQRGRDANRTYRRFRLITACLSRPAGPEDFWVIASAMIPLTRRPHYVVAVRPG